MKKHLAKIRGTSLVEIIFYFALLGMFLAMAMLFAIQISNVSTLSGNIHEIEFSSNELSKLLTSTVQTAQSINTGDSLFDIDGGRLSLNMIDSSVSPTVFYLSEGKVFFKEGEGAAIQLSTPFVSVSKLKFQHLSSYKNPDQIVVDASFLNLNQGLSNIGHDADIHLTLSLRSF